MSVLVGRGDRVGEKNKTVAVDVGRSAVKCVWGYPRVSRFEFDSVLSFNKNPLQQTGGQLGTIKEPLKAVVDGKFILFGDTARVQGDHVFEVTEGDSFVESSCSSIVYSIGRCLRDEADGFDIVLGIDLTYDNFFLKKDFQGRLVGRHTVVLFDGKSVSFEISKVYVLYQGYAGLIDYAMGDTLVVDGRFLGSTGITVDIGRRTVDITYVDNLSVKEGKSFDLGTYRVYERVAGDLRSKFGVMKDVHEIEGLYKSGKNIKLLSGGEVNLSELVGIFAEELAGDVMYAMQGFFAKKTPDYVLLFGGGSRLYEGIIRGKYPVIEVLEDAVFANALGALKFLERVRSEGGF